MEILPKPEWMSDLLYDQIITDISGDEGLVWHIYLDHLGNKTYGVGHLITEDEPEYYMDVGTEVEADKIALMFSLDIREAMRTAQALVPNLQDYPDNVVRVLVNMAFNLGYRRLSRFKRMLKAVRQCDFEEAADEMMDSLWRKQVPNRAMRLVKMMRTA